MELTSFARSSMEPSCGEGNHRQKSHGLQCAAQGAAKLMQRLHALLYRREMNSEKDENQDSEETK